MTKIDSLALPTAETSAETTGPSRGRFLRSTAHPGCVACSTGRPHGLGLEFHDVGDGRVRANFACPGSLEGYPGLLHGGIIATLLDAAMTNCLFALGHRAVTAELSIKYRAPVQLGRTAVVEAQATRDLFPLFIMEATISQAGESKATATAKFIVTKAL
jgi:uncharacterized protein (TIGR00369 family)